MLIKLYFNLIKLSEIVLPLDPNEELVPTQQLFDDVVVLNSLFHTSEQYFQLDHPKAELQYDVVSQQISQ